MTNEHRGKIKTAAILKALEEHTLGLRKMSQTQITAGVALLRKVMPDLHSTTVTGDADNPITHRVIVTGVRRAGDLPRPAIPLRVVNGPTDAEVLSTRRAKEEE
jgi:hypothetical protein